MICYLEYKEIGLADVGEGVKRQRVRRSFSCLLSASVRGRSPKTHSTIWKGRIWRQKFSFSVRYIGMRLRWSRGSVLAFITQVRGFKPGRSRRNFKDEKILSTPSFGGEVKPSVPCRRFAACNRSLNGVEVVISAKLPDNIPAHSSTFRR